MIAGAVRILSFGALATFVSGWICAIVVQAGPGSGPAQFYPPLKFDFGTQTYWTERRPSGSRHVIVTRMGDDGGENMAVVAGDTPRWVPPIEVLARTLNLDPRATVSVEVHAYGWPICAMSTMENRRPTQTSNTWKAGGVEIWNALGRYFLPLQLLPIRFALSTLLWGSVFEAMWIGACVLRSARRRAGGKCAQCGYNHRGLPPSTTLCPECGTAIPATASSPRSGERA